MKDARNWSWDEMADWIVESAPEAHFNRLDEGEVERAYQRSKRGPQRDVPVRPQSTDEWEIEWELKLRKHAVERDAVDELNRMLASAANRLLRLERKDGATRADIQAAKDQVEAFRRELKLAKAGELPSALAALRSV